jgi:hypothetical protein
MYMPCSILNPLDLQGARLRENAEGNANVEEEDGGDEEDEDIDEELGYISPLENVNPYASFKQALTSKHRRQCHQPKLFLIVSRLLAFQMQNAASYQAATTALDIDQQTLLMEVMRIAEQAQAPQL